MVMNRFAHLRSVKLEEEYSVQFECYSTFLAYFKARPGLTQTEVLQRALELAKEAFGDRGSLTLERSSKHGSFACSIHGIDQSSAKILAPQMLPKPKLSVVK